MKHIKIKVIIIMTFILIFGAFVFAEPTEGWKGYGLYNLNDAKMTILKETVRIEPSGDLLHYQGEFLLKNLNGGYIKAILGMPAAGIEKITIADKSTSVKWKKRSLESITNEFDLENQIPQEGFWYVFNISLDPWETKTVKIQFDAVLQQDEEQAYTIDYLNDRKLGFNNEVNKSILSIEIPDFQPYNITSLSGIKPGRIGLDGGIYIHTALDGIDHFEIKYFDVIKAALNRLEASAMRNPKSIAKEFSNGNYMKVITLCDEYIANPVDSQISKEQVLFFKAESLRRLQNYENYLNIVETMDTSSLIPAQLKSKIDYDRMFVYTEQNQQEKLQNLYQQLDQNSSEATKIILQWIDSSPLFGASLQNNSAMLKPAENQSQDTAESKSKLSLWYQTVLDFKFTPVIIFVAGIIIGMMLKRARIKRRRRNSMYLYRM